MSNRLNNLSICACMHNAVLFSPSPCATSIFGYVKSETIVHFFVVDFFFVPFFCMLRRPALLLKHTYECVCFSNTRTTVACIIAHAHCYQSKCIFCWCCWCCCHYCACVQCIYIFTASEFPLNNTFFEGIYASSHSI